MLVHHVPTRTSRYLIVESTAAATGAVEMSETKAELKIPPTEAISISNGLTLTPRIKILLTVFRADTTASTLDEWKLKHSLISFFKSSSTSPALPPLSEDDLFIRRFRDLKKRKREDPVARGSLIIRDLGFIKDRACRFKGDTGGDVDADDAADAFWVLEEKKLLQWRRMLVEKMDGMEVNLEGAKFRLSAALPDSDDFEKMKKEWEEFFAFGNPNFRGNARGSKQEPDMLILRGLPSRWFAEPRVSSKPSMLVTHTIFSTLGKIRNLNVAEDDDLGKDTDEDNADIVAGLYCRVVVQFEKYKDFYNVLKVLCGRSLHKEGSRLIADYEVTWDKEGFFRNPRGHTQENSSRIPASGAGHYGNKAARLQTQISHYSPDSTRRKRFKVPPVNDDHTHVNGHMGDYEAAWLSSRDARTGEMPCEAMDGREVADGYGVVTSCGCEGELAARGCTGCLWALTVCLASRALGLPHVGASCASRLVARGCWPRTWLAADGWWVRG
ncbi:hypothetical protein Dimus_004563 [Dionaea muscipula]